MNLGINYSELFSMILRFAGAGSKFILFLYLAKVMQPSDVGLFALIISAIVLAVQVIGLEIHYYNSRLAASQSELEASHTIDSQIKFHITSHFLLFPFLLWVGAYYLSNFALASIVCALVITEHLSQECIRFLQFRFMAEKGAVVVFVRNGAWGYSFIIFIELFGVAPTVINLTVVWLSFSLVALILASYFLRNYVRNFKSKFITSIKETVRIVKRSWPFLVSTSLFVLSQNIDRFLLDYYYNKSIVGVFFFLSSIASVASMAATFGAGVFIGPLIIKAYRSGQINEYKKLRRMLIIKSVILAMGAALVCISLLGYLLDFIGRNDYASQAWLIYVLLAAGLAQVLMEIYSLELYIRGLDIENMLATIVAVIVLLPIQVVLISELGVLGAGVCAFFSPIIILLTRKYFYCGAINKRPDLVYTFK